MARKTRDQNPKPPAARKGGRPSVRFKPKALKTALARPAVETPLPPRKDADRIAKVIARAGLGSRREAEEWIEAGRVAVNGAVITSPALNVTARDAITVDGQPLPQRERTRLFLYHKPRGLVTTTADPEGRPTIFDALPENLPRLVSVGRLDLNTEGLLLLTNDGGLARVLELPETGWLRRYRVRAHGSIRQDQLDTLLQGVTVDGIHYGPVEAVLDRVQGSNVWLTVAIREGKNREVRNVLGHVGLEVSRLIRVSFGPFQLGDLAEGAVEEVKTRILREQIGERLAAASGADFSAPIIEREAPAERPRPQQEEGERRERRGHAERKREDSRGGRRGASAGPRHERERPERTDRPERAESGHPGTARRGNVWRAAAASEDQAGEAPLKRKFHGSRRDQAEARPDAPVRIKSAALLTDRKGRRVLVQRIGSDAPKSEEPERSSRPERGSRSERPYRADRAAAEGRSRRSDARPRRFDDTGAPRRGRDGGGEGRPRFKSAEGRPRLKGRDQPSGERPGRPRFRDRDVAGGERPSKPRFRDRDSARSEGSGRPRFRERDSAAGERPARREGERPARREGERPARREGERPAAKRGFKRPGSAPSGGRPMRGKGPGGRTGPGGKGPRGKPPRRER